MRVIIVYTNTDTVETVNRDYKNKNYNVLEKIICEKIM